MRLSVFASAAILCIFVGVVAEAAPKPQSMQSETSPETSSLWAWVTNATSAFAVSWEASFSGWFDQSDGYELPKDKELDQVASQVMVEADNHGEERFGKTIAEPPHVPTDYSPYGRWPDFAKDCLNSYGYACKPAADLGGCTGCTPGYIWGAYVECSSSYEGDACDFGPHCSSKACYDGRLGVQPQTDKSLILSALELSALAYVLPEDKQKREQLCHGANEAFQWHFKHYGNSQTRISWGVAHRSFGQHDGEKLYAITFRGTAFETAQSFIENWLTNLKLYGWDLDGMIVHGGFMEALNKHKDKLLKELLEASHGHTRLLITGHSLGGGLATLFAYFAQKALPHMKIELITAGAPRVGDIKFATTLEKKTRLIYRVAGWCDPIPRTPASLFKDGDWISVVHAGPQITLGNKANCDMFKMASTQDHSIRLYIGRLRVGLKGKDNSLCHDGELGTSLRGLVTSALLGSDVEIDALDRDAMTTP